MVARRAVAALGIAVATLFSIELLLFAAERASGRVAALLHGTSRALPDARLGLRPNPALPDHDAAGWRNAERPAGSSRSRSATRRPTATRSRATTRGRSASPR
jgi:hypothetical protein